MFTEGDVRELIEQAAFMATVRTAGERDRDVVRRIPEEVTRDIMASLLREQAEPHAHECEGRLCTVCAEWRARHNLTRHGGCAD